MLPPEIDTASPVGPLQIWNAFGTAVVDGRLSPSVCATAVIWDSAASRSKRSVIVMSFLVPNGSKELTHEANESE
jgi:hypothetical protein